MVSTYDKYPRVQVTGDSSVCWSGWQSIVSHLAKLRLQGVRKVAIECYPGVFEDEIAAALRDFFPTEPILVTRDCLKSTEEINRIIEGDLSADPVFGRLSRLEVGDFFRQEALAELGRRMRESAAAIVVGVGVTLVDTDPDVLVYADLARWQIQTRQRRGEIGNLGADNRGASAAEKYKRAFFVDWRVADRLKQTLLPKLDFLLDTNAPNEPKMIGGDVFRAALSFTARRPFRVQPFFDPGPWGGQWMRRVCDLPADAPNYAWCFDCVPEENSLLLSFGAATVEVPAIDLVFYQPRQLLGDAVYARFGAEFPIRFDFLDTMEGGNLSLQVHPLTSYIRKHFGMTYTQDESYYLLDAGEDACVYLGLRQEIDLGRMVHDLQAAQQAGGPAFPAEEYVNRWPAKKHDHFLIPAGTIHCSGRNSMVLEISATPYIFTFKLWDWGRLGLDGRPRPIHLEHGVANIQWDRTAGFVRRECIDQVTELGRGAGWCEERTGLHALEFIETRRHWFTQCVPHDTGGSVNVLNLVEGAAAVVESPSGEFEPFPVHYAETFIVPSIAGKYTIRPLGETMRPLATIKAFVRTNNQG